MLGACLVVFASWCALGSLGAAQSRDVARVISPLPADLDERLVGQTSDLEWTLESARAPNPRDLDDASRHSQGARVVIWVTAHAGGLRLHFADVRDRRLLVRDFAAPNDEPFGGSANVESVAVAVRGALQALSLGGEVGVAAPEVTPEPPIVVPPDPPPLTRSAVSIEVEAGWWVALDGESPLQHGPTLRLGLRRARLVMGLGGEVGLGARLSDSLTRVTVARHTAFLDVGASLVGGARGGLDLVLRLGVARIARGEVEARVEGVAPEPAVTVTSVLVGTRLSANIALGSHLALRLGLGADVLPAAPVLRYADEAGETQIRNRFWWLQPSVLVALVVRSGGPQTEVSPPRENLASSVTRFRRPASLWRRWQ